MKKKIMVHPFCDVCGKELTVEEKSKNDECENYEYPICDDCFKGAMEKIDYILNR